MVALLAAATTSTPVDAPAAEVRSYGAGSFALLLDGVTAGTLQAVSGGMMLADVVIEPALTRGGFPKKHLSTARFDPLHMQVTLPMTKPFSQWLSAAFAGKPLVKTGTLVSFDGTLKEREQRKFTNFRLVELGFPALDAASKDLARLTVVAQADAVVIGPPTGQSAPPPTTKPAPASSFRLTLGDLDTTRVSKISSISVKLSPRGEVSNFSVVIADASADSWRKWYSTFVVKGQGTDTNEKTGALEIFAADMRTAVLRLVLEGVGILRLDPAPQEIGRLKAELYVEGVRLEPP